ncbi:hypothetical protein SS50377_21848 [Spironucleus salmonicida]|uniref:Uncharacterized protein n=1 Tax=Spironucleus salmonicida TaxID=348837 RepID=V6LIM0_9EUKA|nr:hypothetical protein SS50377_21848 [Spironucleus salmonicida]|eukprot:EST44392.1 Hypothetical protein SS50377_15695 [Spironucleus salmonicida]
MSKFEIRDFLQRVATINTGNIDTATLSTQYNITEPELVSLIAKKAFGSKIPESLQQHLKDQKFIEAIQQCFDQPLIKQLQLQVQQRNILMKIAQNQLEKIELSSFNFKAIKANDREVLEMRKRLHQTMKIAMKKAGVDSLEEVAMSCVFERWAD